jgi:hypothetical protein
MKGRRPVKEWFWNLDMSCVCVPFRGWMGKTKDLSPFERGMVVGARRTSLSVSRTAPLLGFSHSTVSRLCQDWSTTQRTSSQHDTTVGSIGVEMGQHPCGMLLTHCSRCTGEFRLFWGQRGQLNIVLFFLPLIFLWPPLIIDANTFLGSVYTMRYIMLKLVCRAG